MDTIQSARAKFVPPFFSLFLSVWRASWAAASRLRIPPVQTPPHSRRRRGKKMRKGTAWQNMRASRLTKSVKSRRRRRHTHTQRDNGLYLHTYPPATLNTENELFSFSPCLSECFVLLSVCGTNKIKTKYISFLFPFKTEYGWLPESAASASLGAIKDH